MLRSCLLVVAACGTGTPLVGPDAQEGPPDRGLVIYLNYEGVTLSPTPGAPEASTNTTNAVDAVTTVPAYLAGDAGRTTKIAAITAAVTARFAPFDVEIVTARPAVPGFYMIVVTGAASVLGGGFSNATGLASLSYQGCTSTPPIAMNPHGLSFLFQSAATTDIYGPQLKANLALANVALPQSVPPTTKPGDCLCYADPGCTTAETPCTIGAASTPVDVMHACPGTPATVDEHAALIALFGAK